jgi:hypothetical protein
MHGVEELQKWTDVSIRHDEDDSVATVVEANSKLIASLQ